MFRADSLLAPSSFGGGRSDVIAAPAPSASALLLASYSPLANEVVSEVRSFIEHGGASAMDASIEARWHASQALSAAQGGSTEKVDFDGVQDSRPLGAAQQAFLSRIEPWARSAAAALGISPELVQAHAALESGWGQRPLTDATGRDSNNLFGVKSSTAWKGDVVNTLTTEYEAGIATKQTESFRRYASLGEAFDDYTRLLSTNSRFRAALNVGNDASAFARALANGGYATDPAYATKLTNVAAQIASTKSQVASTR